MTTVRRTRLEITPAMIEAGGLALLDGSELTGGFSAGDAEYFAKKVLEAALAVRDPTQTVPRELAIQKIEAERRRQIEVEGWTLGHDDAHVYGEMMTAAVSYYMHAMHVKLGCHPIVLRADGAPLGWPWDAAWWKPKNVARDLERAGALVMAERERLLRRDPNSYVTHCDERFNKIVDALAELV